RSRGRPPPARREEVRAILVEHRRHDIEAGEDVRAIVVVAVPSIGAGENVARGEVVVHAPFNTVAPRVAARVELIARGIQLVANAGGVTRCGYLGQEVGGNRVDGYRRSRAGVL